MPEEVKEERRARFMAVQEKISAARLKRKVGRRITVLVDEVGARRRHRALRRRCAGNRRRRARQAATRSLKAGEFARVKITGADAHDLWATATG